MERNIINHIINEEIGSDKVLIIGESGDKQEFTKLEALEIANKQDLDLVQMSKTDEYAVCKLLDYSKFLYEQKKKEKRIVKNKQELKEVRLGDSIAEHDMQIKAKAVNRILNEGDKVQVTITYKGRMMQFIGRGLDKLVAFEKLISCEHIVDKQPNIMGNKVSMIVSTNKK